MDYNDCRLAITDGGVNHEGLPHGINQNQLEKAIDASSSLQQWFIGTAAPIREQDTDGLAGRIINHAGIHLGKYEPPVSLSTHIINTVIVGVNAYVYDTIVRAGEEPDPEQGRLLVAALALHDANKYVEQEYEPEFDTSDNSAQVLDFYFTQGDDFGIRSILPGETETEIEQDIRDIKWLIQRTETREEGIDTRGQASKRVRGLERYCRIGDGFVSKVGVDGLAESIPWLKKRYANDDYEHVQFIRFTALEQPIITNHLLGIIKAVIGRDDMLGDGLETGTEPHGILLGTTNNSVAYLGKPIDRDKLRSTVESTLMDVVTAKHDFDCKTEWRSFEPDILEEINIGFEAKREIIGDGYAETLKRGSGTDHEFERVPVEFRAYLPELAQLVFENQNFEEVFADLTELPRLREQVLESDDYNNQTWKIGFLAELLRRYGGAVDDGYDPETLDEELQIMKERVRPELKAVLHVEEDAAGSAVDRFFTGGQSQLDSLPGSTEMCFLCGRSASTEYKKGNDAFYGTNKFSRRVPPEGQYKRICSVCNLEHALLKDHCESLDSRVGDDTEIAFVYYDEFLAGMSIGQYIVYDLLDEETGYDVSNPELVANTLSPQFHLQPFYAGGQNGRLATVRTLLQNLVGNGLKVIIGKPFTSFCPESALFVDLNPGRRQAAFGADRIETAAERRQVLDLFELLGKVAGNSGSIDKSNAYISIGDDRFQTVADLVVQHTDWYSEVRELADDYFRNHANRDQYMLMRKVAQDGLDLYGEQYDSRHKKTKIFREAIDATLDGLNRDKTRAELEEHVAGQVYKAARTEKFAPHTTTEKAKAFVESFFAFLEAENAFDKATLSRRRNTLTNTYLFAYDQLLNEQREKQEQEASD